MLDIIGKVLAFLGTVWSFLLGVLNSVWPFLAAVLLFGIVIFVHELGHFTFARLFKIKVNEFALGMGPKLFSRKRKNTLYSLRIFPFGGFCAMGEDDEIPEDALQNNDESDNGKDILFRQAKVWKRILVIAGGAIFNIIFGLILVIIMTAILANLNSLPSTTVDKFAENSISEASGLQIGDKIVSINGRAIYNSDDVNYMLMLNREGVYEMTVIRGGERIILENVKLPLVPIDENDENSRMFPKRDFRFRAIKPSFETVLSQGTMKTVSIGRFTWMSLTDLISGRVDIAEMSGPVGITQSMGNVVGEAAKTAASEENGVQWAFVFLLNFIALITINLGMFNLLPIPALDGSRIVFLVIEGIRRKPIPPKKEGMVHAIGLAILLLFIIAISFKDVWFIFK